LFEQWEDMAMYRYAEYISRFICSFNAASIFGASIWYPFPWLFYLIIT